jgi:CheY-like chemotaxis protein
MGGRLWVDSLPGKGSTFHFTAEFGLEKPAHENTQDVDVGILHGLPILVVDDNPTSRQILSEILVSWNMAPESAGSAEAALLILEQAHQAGKPFPLVLLDRHMPDGDGFELAQKLAANPGITDHTVMMLTSNSQLADAARCRELKVAAQIVKPITQSELLNAILQTLGKQAISTVERPTTAAPSPLRHQQLRLLLAEDNVVNQRLVVSLLEKLGHTVVVAGNGQDALAIFKGSRDFDAILMDVQMPGMDGFQTTAAIREWDKEQGEHTPIIALTANAMRGDSERCLEAGMDGYVAKPIRFSDLLEQVQKHVPRAVQH